MALSVESALTIFAESARNVAEVQIKRLKEEMSTIKERTEQEIEALRLKLQQVIDREQSNLEKERKEKLELKEANVRLESEQGELRERVQQLLSVEQEFKVSASTSVTGFCTFAHHPNSGFARKVQRNAE